MSVRPERVWRLMGVAGDIEVAVDAIDGPTRQRAAQLVQSEISRLEGVFDRDDDASMFSRWIADPSITTSREFDEFLLTALRWQRSSGGVFNVSVRRLRDLWSRAAVDGCRPSSGELHELVLDIADAPFRFDGHALRRIRDCGGLDLGAIGRAFALDVAIETTMTRCDLEALTVSLGDKIVHRGAVGIEVELCCALAPGRVDATPRFLLRSGAVGVVTAVGRKGGGWGDQIWDPVTGHPAICTAPVAVVAPDATSADAIATVVSVMGRARGLEFVDSLNLPHRPRHPSEFVPFPERRDQRRLTLPWTGRHTLVS